MSHLIDTHCHLDFNTYDGQRDDLVREAAAHGVTRIINPGADLPRTRAALALAEAHPGVFAGVGVHPNNTASFVPEMVEELRALAAHPKVVAVGEIGLDYYREDSPHAAQRAAFEAQLTLAASLGLPVIIHNRDADEDVLGVLAEWVKSVPDSLRARPGVLHSFSAPLEISERGLALGFYIGFTGPVTFKNADDLRRVAARVPLDRILVETDAPFLTPEPYRGRRPNRPAFVRFVAQRLAALHNLPDDAFYAQTTANAERLFALPPEAD